MKILVADKFPEAHLDRLRAAGHECRMSPGLDADDLPAAIPGFNGLVVRSTRVTPATIAAADQLAVIIRAGAGVNTIAVNAAADRAIFVCNTPGQNAVAVAELTMGLILAIDRNIPDNVAALRDGAWHKKRYSKAKGLAGRTLGIVGFGAIGTAVATRARAFEMDVVVIDHPDGPQERTDRIDRIGARTVPDLETLAATADILTFHVPANDATTGLISGELLDRMKPGAFIINTSRGSLVDEEALIAAMDSKGIRAGLDVYRDEPSSGDGRFDSALARHPNVYGTHHIGASTEQAQDAIAAAVVNVIESFASGTLINCVNLRERAGDELTVTVRHFNRIGVLAAVLGTLREAGLNVEHMENFVLAGRKGASVVIHVVGTVEAETVADLEKLDNVIAVSVSHR